VERGVDWPLPVAQAGGFWADIARRQVRRLLAAWLPSPREAVSVLQPF
jgi:hypothetical protein